MELDDSPNDDKMRSNGRHDEIEALDFQGREAKDQPGYSRRKGSAGESQPEGHAKLGAQNRRRVSSDGHEAGMSDGDLAAVAGQNVEPMDTDHRDTYHGQNGKHPVAAEEGAGK
jgi:hypothetical protein